MKTLDEVRAAVRNAVEEASAELIAVGEHIWKNPEPGYREVKTSAYLVEKLRALGLEVRTGLAMTGFRADIDTGRPGPTVAFLGEMDSLVLPNHPECDPVTGAAHACGHNCSAATLVGVATGLLKSGVLDSLCGKIALIATPAEEMIEMSYRKKLMEEGKICSISGKSQLICEGVFDDVDVAFMNHISTSFGYYDHNGCLNKQITFRGKSCHAAVPQEGVNALNGANLALHAIGLLRESLGYSKYFRIHGIITGGGDAVNIIPDKVTAEYMLRAPTMGELVKLNERFDKIVMHAAKAAECEVAIETVLGCMPLYDSKMLGDCMKETVEYLAPGAFFGNNDLFYASCTDMGDVATVIPSVHAYAPGCAGTSHGIDFRISDPHGAYVVNSQFAALTIADLLYGDGEKAKSIAAGKKDLTPIPDYIATVKRINKTVDSADLA